jgi:hypothetical protein
LPPASSASTFFDGRPRLAPFGAGGGSDLRALGGIDLLALGGIDLLALGGIDLPAFGGMDLRVGAGGLMDLGARSAARAGSTIFARDFIERLPIAWCIRMIADAP